MAVAVPLTLQVSSETAPADGWAQIKVSAVSPARIASGTISMDLDPAVFGDIASIAVFSATGDQIGYANVKGGHVDAHFSSSSGGIGQLPGAPVFAVTIPVLEGAASGTTRSITAGASGASWTDPQGNPYTVSVTPGRFTVGGSLSIAGVTPGGGLLPEGTVVAIRGTGFQPGTAVSIDGAVIDSVQFISPQQINVTLAGATELTGKRIQVDGVDFFPALPSAGGALPDGLTAVSGVHVILPFTAFNNTQLVTGFEHPSQQSIALLNSNVDPVTITLLGTGSTFGSNLPADVVLAETLTIQPGTLSFLQDPVQGTLGATFWVTAAEPIRMGVYTIPFTFGGPPPPATLASPVLTRAPPTSLQLRLQASPASVSWSWQAGAALPPPASVQLSGSLGFTVAASASWLSIQPSQGTAPATITLAPELADLGPGNYTATVTVTPVAPASLAGYTVLASTVNVSLAVSSAPLITTRPQTFCCSFFAPGANGTSPPGGLLLTTNGDPAPFTVTVNPGTGGNWLSVTPLSGTTPATLTVKVNPAGLADGRYSSEILIQGPANTVTVPVGLLVLSPPPPPPPATSIQVSPASLSFLLIAGSGPPAVPRVITIHPNGVSYSAQTQSGAGWMTTALFANDAQTIIQVNASAANLAAGTYRAVITITLGTLAPAQVPVTLTVLSAPTAETILTATPPSLSLAAQAGQSQQESLIITSNGPPVQFNFSFVPGTAGGLRPFSATAVTPYQIDFLAEGSSLLPGIYQGHFVITWATGSITVPVTFSVSASPSFPPIIGSIVSAASARPGGVAPGEIISILGTGLGPSSSEVLIGGRPAPVLHTSSTQVNAIVPTAPGTATVQVISNGAESGVWKVPLVSSAPSIFTLNFSGAGQAAILNQDNSVNGPSNPAPRGTTLQIFGTGRGSSSAPVTVTIGGENADVQYAEEVDGLLQVSAVVPQAVKPGPAIPISIAIGSAKSPDGVTVSIQ